jgi:adenylate/nucleoside-diphosphate kinase
MAALKSRRQQERDEARQKAIDEALPEEEWPSAAPPEGGDEEDPEAPKLEEMLNEKKEKLVAQYEADLARLDELFTLFTEELKIPSNMVNGDGTIV